MSIRIVMVLTLMAGWIAKILYVKSAFLHGEFDEEEIQSTWQCRKDLKVSTELMWY